MGKKIGLPMIPVLADNADYLDNLGFLTGKNAKKNPKIILDYLREKEQNNENFVFDIFNYKHRYPACWRCKTELVWKVADEWYIAMDLSSKSNEKNKNKTLRQRMIEVAKKINWLPAFGLDRELDWLSNMSDWLISKKNRYWGLALPIYVCKKCNNFEILGSKEELQKRAIKGWNTFEGNTPHKPYIDEVIIYCKKCGGEASRVEDVGNPWLDAGIVPFSTISKDNDGIPLYLKDKKTWEKWFPADFITESFPGQFKNWFYSLIATSTVLEDTNSFKTVLGFGTLLGENGQPMHKSWGNAIEFNEGADKIGVDVMRWMYLRSNPSDNLLFGYKHADEIKRRFYLILWNIYKYFIDYVFLEKVDIKALEQVNSNNILDKWILSRFANTQKVVDESLVKFNAQTASSSIEIFINDISTWYIRRSRNRLWKNSENCKDKNFFYETLYFILKNLSLVLVPFLPFISEEIYSNLTDGLSAHLSDWPENNHKFIDNNLEVDMNLVRKIAEKGHSERKSVNIALRQPLSSAVIEIPTDISEKNLHELKQIILEELNLKKINLKTGKEIKVILNTKITLELKEEGEVRNIIRKIQSERKNLGIKPNEYINVQIDYWPKKLENEIKKKSLIKKIEENVKFKVIKA